MKVYTIGHSTYEVQYFIELLTMNSINCIIDIRSTPYSKYAQQFNKEQLKYFLNRHNIVYIHMGSEFGARRNKRELYNNAGYLDFERTRKDSLFLEGIERIKQGYLKGYTMGLMCSEKDPLDCHRSIMVSKGLIDNGIEVMHILEDGNLESHHDLEIRMLDKYYKDRDQVSFSLVPDFGLSDSEMIERSYKRRNLDIGYDITNEL